MTKAEYIAKAEEWLTRAENAHSNDAKQLALAANMYARGHLAASVASVYATLAITAE